MDLKKAIRALLQSKFGGVQLSAARVEQLAKRFKGKVEKEEDLEEKLSEFNEIYPLADIAKEDDRQRGLQEELAKLKDGSDKNDTDEETTPADPKLDSDNEQPEWVKAMLETQKTLMTEISALKTGKVANDRKSAILSKLNGADENYSTRVVRDFGRMNFESDEAFEEYLSDVEEDFKAHQQSIAESKLGNDQPFSGIGNDGKVTEASEQELDAVMNEIGL